MDDQRNLEMAVPEAAVIIPVYKDAFTKEEMISLTNCFTVLKDHAIIIVAPATLDLFSLNRYKHQFAIEKFSDDFFTSLSAYNKLMMSRCFYERFKGFKFLLIHQLDSYVFKDDLSRWCAASYDYIGAPWINQDWWWKVKWFRLLNPFKKDISCLSRFRTVGNGGFSLRKTSSFINALIKLETAVHEWSLNEDLFWSFFVPEHIPSFNIPAKEVALSFAFETYPRHCFKLNRSKLPFGCHGWNRYDVGFWQKYILQ